mmetsp:Transcript_130298/g.363020  ORF Transcript_130298/g.363020 Transcript_130298/m.363020 type:complete len:443 (-) Transcript_130298:307-1635(-)
MNCCAGRSSRCLDSPTSTYHLFLFPLELPSRCRIPACQAASKSPSRPRLGCLAVPRREGAQGLGRLPPAGNHPVLHAVAGLEGALLHHRNKVHSAAAAGGDVHAPRGEHVPAPPGAFTIDFNDLILLRLPVQLPRVEGPAVAEAHVLHGLNLEAGLLQVGDHPAERCGRVSAGEDVLLHEEAPDKLFVAVVALGVAALQAGDLDVEDPVVLKQGVHLLEVLVVVGDARVLSHLDRGDDVEALQGQAQVLVEVLVEDGHVLPVLPVHALAVGEEVAGRHDARDVRALAGEELRETAPPAANVQGLHPRLDAQRVDDVFHLPELRGLQGLVHVLPQVVVEATRVEHGLAERGLEPVVALVVAFGNVLGVLGHVVEYEAKEVGPKITLRLPIANGGCVLPALDDRLGVALAGRAGPRLDVLLEGAAEGREREVVAFLGCNVAALP